MENTKYLLSPASLIVVASGSACSSVENAVGRRLVDIEERKTFDRYTNVDSLNINKHNKTCVE